MFTKYFWNRFWNKVSIYSENECWHWNGSKKPSGHGIVTTNRYFNERTQAHRLAYLWEYGDFDRSKIIRHTCDNPSCVNPNHLIIGTHSDNIRDYCERQLPYKDTERLDRILNKEAVKVIKWYLKQGTTARKLAKLYKVHESTIKGIKSGKNWSHIRI